MSDLIFRYMPTSAQTKADTAGRSYLFVLTSGSPDLEGDRVNITGMDLSTFLRNPVALRQHKADSPIGTWGDIRKVGAGFAGRITARLTLAPQGVSGAADEAAGLIEAGILRGASVGFLPTAPGVPNTFGGMDWPATRLLEASICALPANTDALRAASLGARREQRFGLGDLVLLRAGSSEPTAADATGVLRALLYGFRRALASRSAS